MQMIDTTENDEENHKISDRDLPLSFCDDRHLDVIEGLNSINQTWRMKERVSFEPRTHAPLDCLLSLIGFLNFDFSV